MMGEKIRVAIDAQGMTVEKLADALDVTVQSVYRWIRNEVTPSVQTLRDIARLTDRPIYYFISEATAETLDRSRKLGTISVSIDGERVFSAPVKRTSDINVDLDHPGN